MSERRMYRCPIPGCRKVFYDFRGDWDAHVGSPRKHLNWRWDIVDPQERKRLFKAEFAAWFRGR